MSSWIPRLHPLWHYGIATNHELMLLFESSRTPIARKLSWKLFLVGRETYAASKTIQSMVLAWMLWQIARKHGCYYGAGMDVLGNRTQAGCSPKNAMRNGTNDFEALEAPKLGGCQNYGPSWIPIIIRHRIFRVPKKGP